jgi:RNA polymerase sigma factor (sigma-70 family)
MHESDLELAHRCAAGDEAAWEEFVREYRPVLYRAAESLDPSGGARELADSLYAELYGIAPNHDGERRPLFRYFHGRSSLATWLRAVLVQRYIDRARAARRLQSLPDDDDSACGERAAPAPPTRTRYLGLVRAALRRVVDRLDPRDRLRLASYYVQELTLAETGRLLGEHEATVSRRLARTRRNLRGALERDLRCGGLRDAEIEECFACAADDPGPIDLQEIFDTARGGESAAERSS